MPGHFLVLSRDLHTRKTARGATAVPRGMQPILVETVCAGVAAIEPACPSERRVFRSSARAVGGNADPLELYLSFRVIFKLGQSAYC